MKREMIYGGALALFLSGGCLGVVRNSQRISQGFIHPNPRQYNRSLETKSTNEGIKYLSVTFLMDNPRRDNGIKELVTWRLYDVNSDGTVDGVRRDSERVMAYVAAGFEKSFGGDYLPGQTEMLPDELRENFSQALQAGSLVSLYFIEQKNR